ncbi:hypothetical protein JKG47_07555 [Acidithiobacillus sp. MC6.1]|nr:hypothetical protein [Acidithiobacillus sp. MC6.1]
MGEKRMKGRAWMALAGVACSLPAGAFHSSCPTGQAAVVPVSSTASRHYHQRP